MQLIDRGLKCQLFTRLGYQVSFRHVGCTATENEVKKKKKKNFTNFPVTAGICNFEECGEPAVASFHRSGVLFQGIANCK